MASVGNKGKFSDRLKRMKLIRYAKKMRIKIDNGLLLKCDADLKLSDSSKKVNKSVDNRIVINNNSKDNKAINVDYVDNLNSNSLNKNNTVDKTEKESTSGFIKRKAVETASVGAAVIGAIGVNLLGGSSNLKTPVDKVDSKDSRRDTSSTISDYGQKFILNDSSRGSSQRVFNFGNKNIILSNDDKKNYLAAQIIKKIKREFESNLNELEVLENELYILNNQNEYELDLERCREIKKEIQEIISKINHIIEQYNIYQYNRFLDDMLDIDDSTLVDDISDFKRLYEGADLQKRLVNDSELIKEYQLLYSKLDNIKNNVEEVAKKNEDKVFDYAKRDKKYANIKDRILVIEKFQENCEYYIEKQNEYIDNIADKVSRIDIDYVVNYKLQGFGNLVGGTLKYLGMLMFSPFSSLLPGIAFKNFAANRMVHNLRSALQLEKVTSTVYLVEDLQFQLDDKINTLDYNYDSVDKTLDNIKKLKKEFMNQYNYDIPGYNKTLRNINEIEGLVYNNKEKLDLIRNKLKKNKKINEDTLKKVRVLEKETKPTVERV